jgi:hypothetical protein
MKGRNTITINGRAYDAISGMPLPNALVHQRAAQQVMAKILQPTPHITYRSQNSFTVQHSKVASPAVHKQLQRSQTLHRAALRRPEPAVKPSVPAPANLHYRSPVISKFGLPPSPLQTPTHHQLPDEPPATPPTVHPTVARALSHMEHNQAPAKPQPAHSPKELKEMLIRERLAEVDAAEASKPKKERGFLRRHSRLTTALAGSLAVLVLGGYLTFINLPNISMRVAATRAGVAATLPSYHPDGYSFAGPIAYSPGQVAVSFKSNTNDHNFTITQKASNWDSQAVLDNYVSRQTDSYLTYQEHGLTIYSFDNKAAWVNGGLLYTMDGTGDLTSDQILHIATSM